MRRKRKVVKPVKGKKDYNNDLRLLKSAIRILNS